MEAQLFYGPLLLPFPLRYHAPRSSLALPSPVINVRCPACPGLSIGYSLPVHPFRRWLFCKGCTWGRSGRGWGGGASRSVTCPQPVCKRASALRCCLHTLRSSHIRPGTPPTPTLLLLCCCASLAAACCRLSRTPPEASSSNRYGCPVFLGSLLQISTPYLPFSSAPHPRKGEQPVECE